LRLRLMALSQVRMASLIRTLASSLGGLTSLLITIISASFPRYLRSSAVTQASAI
jgi:hypothetical protein